MNTTNIGYACLFLALLCFTLNCMTRFNESRKRKIEVDLKPSFTIEGYISKKGTANYSGRDPLFVYEGIKDGGSINIIDDRINNEILIIITREQK